MEQSQPIKSSINGKLEMVYDLLFTNYQEFGNELYDLICNPQKIENTNHFASILVKLRDFNFIESLLDAINASEIGDSWLMDFMYAVTRLLDDAPYEDTFEMPDGLIEKLGDWMLKYPGETSWKAAMILKHSETAKAEKVLLRQLNVDDFFGTHVECIIGLLRYDEKKHMELVHQIANDETRDKKLRDYCSSLLTT